jgi:putative hydrolase
VYFHDSEHREGQHTVVTETQGPLRGRRVVRGRETECAAFYAGQAAAAGGRSSACAASPSESTLAGA